MTFACNAHVGTGAYNGFVKYNARIFSWEDQRRLVIFARELAGKGCKVVVSNADHPSIDKLYPVFKRFRIERPSVIAAGAQFRKTVTESLFVGLSDCFGSCLGGWPTSRSKPEGAPHLAFFEMWGLSSDPGENSCQLRRRACV